MSARRTGDVPVVHVAKIMRGAGRVAALVFDPLRGVWRLVER